MVGFNPEQIDSAYREALSGDSTARERFVLLALPLAEIATDQLLRRNSYFIKHREELIDQGRLEVIESVNDLLSRSKPVYSARGFISAALERQVLNHALEFTRAAGIGPKPRTIRKNWSNRRNFLTGRMEAARKARNNKGGVRQCALCDQPHDTDNWYPIVKVDRKKKKLQILDFVCREAWERGNSSKRWHDKFLERFNQKRVYPIFAGRDEATEEVLNRADKGTGPQSHELRQKLLLEDILSRCKDDRQRDIVTLKAQGIPNKEIAQRVKRSVSTVQLTLRKLRREACDTSLAV